MTQTTLSKETIKHLKALAHHLQPVLIVGDKGLTPSFMEEANQTLLHHELIKVKITGDRERRDTLASQLGRDLDAHLIQKIGHMAIFFKRNKKALKIEI